MEQTQLIEKDSWKLLPQSNHSSDRPSNSNSSNKIDNNNNTKNGLSHFIAGGIGGIVGATLTAPLDVVRTRLQSSTFSISAIASNGKTAVLKPHNAYFKTISALRLIAAKEGIAGLYSGLGPNLFGIIPARSIQFAAYGQTKNILLEFNKNKDSPLIHLMSAAVSGVTTATLTSPIWMVKTRMQLDGAHAHKNSFDCFKKIVRNEGIKGLYKGISASYLGTVEICIHFVLYEKFKKIIRQQHDGGTGKIAGIVDYFGAAAMAKLIASIISYPHEVARTRMRQRPEPSSLPQKQLNYSQQQQQQQQQQSHASISSRSISSSPNPRSGAATAIPSAANASISISSKYSGLWKTFRIIWIEEGVYGLYGGICAHLMRTVPNAAVMFMAYELVLDYFD
ncbi:putative mitochondrial carrier [Smittium culicis]|uniref:Putative mitochondrial carrier n=1 Tax=Smittium culicis TaxID=133412 RepID=A0A1R1Y095_9FUNG|nr:putative mitochondrial carrier [Smittium culicis]